MSGPIVEGSCVLCGEKSALNQGICGRHSDEAAQAYLFGVADRTELEAQVYAPGHLECPKCNFHLYETNLYMGSGTTGPGDTDKREVCPNDGVDMNRVTWKEICRGMQKGQDLWLEKTERQETELVALRARVEAARKLITTLGEALEAMDKENTFDDCGDGCPYEGPGGSAEDCVCVNGKVRGALFDYRHREVLGAEPKKEGV